MKVMFINQFFWPDSAATSQQLTDMAAGLAQRGFDVTVLCSDVAYADASSGTAPAGVRIIRVKSLPFVRGTVGRVLSYLSFYVFALIRGLTAPRQDVVVSLTTPPLISLLGSAMKMLRRSRHFIWEQDIYPDVAIDLNYFSRGGVLDRVVGLLADFSRNHADGVVALGQCMKSRLVARGIPAERIFIVENWANGDAIQPLPRPGDPKELVLLYSGNLGLAHDVDTLTGAMLALRYAPGSRSRFRYLFVGGGGKRKELAAFCEANAIENVELRPYVPRDRLGEGLAAGDIGVVTQHEICCGSVVPSKVYGILAAGRPVLFVGPREATPALTIHRHSCGWQIDPGDVAGLTNLLEVLADNPMMVREAGYNARRALLVFYDLPQSIDRMAAVLEERTESRTQSERISVSSTAA